MDEAKNAAAGEKQREKRRSELLMPPPPNVPNANAKNSSQKAKDQSRDEKSPLTWGGVKNYHLQVELG
jgi:hypothetical protein